jgi:RHS repeat-associated protein
MVKIQCFRFQYNGFGSMEKSIDASGYFVVYEYDDVVHSYITKTSDAFGYYSEATYKYEFGTEETITDTNDNTFTKEYDLFGRTRKILTDYDSPDSPAVEFEYFHTDFPARAVTNNKIFFNDSHNPVSYDESETLDTVIIIDGMGRVLQTKKEGEVLMDSDVTSTHGMNISGKVVYDDMGRVWQQGQPVFQDEVDYLYYNTECVNATSTTYDILGRTLETELPDDKHSTITNEYRVTDGLFKTIVTDPNGNRKVSFADVRENVIQLDQFNRGKTITTRYEYSLLNEIEQVIDAKNNVTSIAYDSLGRRTSISNPDSGLVEYGYDVASNLVWKQDNNLRARDKRIEYEYTYSRLDRIVYPDSIPVTYHYGDMGADHNRAGRIWKVEDESGTKEYFYGRLGQEEKVIQTYNSLTLGLDPITFETQYGYDYIGRMNWIQYPDEEVLHYEYDNGGQIQKVYSEHRNHTFNYIDHIYYDEFGQRKRITYENGVTTDYTYDPTRRWLEHIETKNDYRTFQNMQYEFDQVGNVTSTLNVGTGEYGVGTTTTEQTYTYDDLYQLTGAVGTHTVSSPSRSEIAYSQDFQYDEIGNMTSKVSSRRVNPLNGNPNDLNYNFSYQYNPNKPHQAYKIGDWTYTYDSNGNVIRKNLGGGEQSSHTTNDFDMENTNRPTNEHDGTNWLTRERETTTTTIGTTNESPYDIEVPRDEEEEEIDVRFTWNEENRLVESTVSGETTKYLYDGSGERTIKKGKFGETTYVNKFFQLQNRDTITKHIFVGESRIVSKLSHHEGTGDLEFEKNNIYYYHPDHLGNTTYITDKDGNEWEHFEYTPYGETWVTEENRTHSFGYRFTGKELDEETNLYYFGARYLGCKTSRWLSADPAFADYLPTTNKEKNKNLLGQGGVFNPTNLNCYNYSNNNPLLYKDPDGNAALVGVVAVVVVVGLILLNSRHTPPPQQQNNQETQNNNGWAVSHPYGEEGATWNAYGGQHFGRDRVYRVDGENQTENQSVNAVEDGTVALVTTWNGERNTGNPGNQVITRHRDENGNIYYRSYQHLNEIDVERGDAVTTDTQIGTAGNTGYSFGAHTHDDRYYRNHLPAGMGDDQYIEVQYGNTTVYYVDPEI